MPADARLVVYCPDGTADLSAAVAGLGLPQGAPGHLRLARPVGARVELVDSAVRTIPLRAALPALLAVPAHGAADSSHSWKRVPDTLAVWSLAARLANRLVARHQLVPTLVLGPEGHAHGVWRATVEDDAEAGAMLARLAAAMPRAGHAVGAGPDAVWEPSALLGVFLDAVADLIARDGNDPPRAGRPRARLLPWTARWAEALVDPADPTVPLREDAAELVASIAGWQAAGDHGGPGTAELHLSAPESQDGPWRLDIAVRTDDGVLHPAASIWRPEDDGTGEDAYGPDSAALQETLLRALGRCARIFPPLDAVLRQATPVGLDLDLDQAWRLLTDAAPLLSAAGVVLRLPGDIAERRLRARIRVGAAPDGPDGAAAGGTDGTAGLPALEDLPGIRASSAPASAEGVFGGLLAGFRWEVALGDETLTQEEFEAIVAAQAPLVRWRDRWIHVDPAALGPVGRAGEGGELTLAEALALGLQGSVDAGRFTDEEAEPIEVVADGGVAAVLDRIRAAADHPPVPATPDGFAGELRPYQRRGVAWLEGMGDLGLGAVLADDMGLGKTIELTAYLLSRPTGGPFLIVCPTSVVGNWERELNRFAPDLPVTRHHGAERAGELTDVKGAVLTTYGTLRRDVDVLAAVEWDVVTLDEAQQVKNATTAAARAVRRLRSNHTVAMTGTPLENRLAELWSLLDATNPGLLGTRATFGRRFAVPIEKRRDRAAALRLRRLVAPFVLRREKSDPTVIADLPDKIERTVVCPLTAEQAALYQAAVDRTLGGLSGARSMERRGRILALLTELKQICNHPAQYLGEGGREAAAGGWGARGEGGREAAAGGWGAQGEGGRAAAAPLRLAGRSGKLAAACEIVTEATDAGDRLLLFTQYVVMGRLLVAQLSADLGVAVPFLHGGLAPRARDRMVEAFQTEPDSSPVLVVSLRAGGTGLNLTAATHVMHYDRWWNPAVEDQATDRAHRIGQTRTVEVHKLVTAGTLEERIAELLERKRALADTVVGAGETWITELDDSALAELVALSRDAPITDLTDEDDEEPPR